MINVNISKYIFMFHEHEMCFFSDKLILEKGFLLLINVL